MFQDSFTKLVVQASIVLTSGDFGLTTVPRKMSIFRGKWDMQVCIIQIQLFQSWTILWTFCSGVLAVL